VFADEPKLPLRWFLATGTSKLEQIQHRLFAFITLGCGAKGLLGDRTIVQLIAATTTDTSLKV
jgi:hypothetical protein